MESTREGRAKKGKSAKIGLWVARLLLVWSGAELAALAVLAWMTGGAPFAGLEAERDALAIAGHGNPELTRAGVNPTTGFVVHPYLGFVSDFDARDLWPVNEVGHPINAFGFIDSNHPMMKRGEDRVVVAILGGSVAGSLAILAESTIVQQIEASGRYPGRKVEIVRMALGGWKQPQQLIALAYHMALGGEYDLVINLDGFNDMAFVLDNQDRGVTPVFPRLWDRMAERVNDIGEQRLIGELVYVREERRRSAESARDSILSWSPLRRVAWKLADQGLRRRIEALTLKVSAPADRKLSYAATGHGALPVGRDEVIAFGARFWMQCSVLMNDLCVRHGAVYWHVLQPNQYVAGSKPIGPEEAGIALTEGGLYRSSVESGYGSLIALGPELAGHGVNFLDMTRVFADVTEPLYIDNCCHLNEKGNRILAERMMRHILAN